MPESLSSAALRLQDHSAGEALALIRRGGTLVFAVQVAGAGLAYAQQVLLARLLGASQFGIYTYVYLYASFAALLAGMGLPAASMRYLPTYRGRGEQSRLDSFVRNSSRLTYLTAFAAALVAILLGALLYALGVLDDPATLIFAGLLVPALSGSMVNTELARASDRMLLAFLPPQVARPALIALAVGAIALTGRLSTATALAGTLAAAFAALAVQHRLTRRLFTARTAVAPSASDRRSWLMVGLSLLAVSAFVIVLAQVDIVIVGALCGSRDAGVYAAASRTAALVSFVIVAVNAAAAPRFAALWAEGRRLELQLLVRRLAGLVFWPSLAISVVIAVLAGPVLELFGSGFRSGRLALLVLLVGQLVNAAAGSVGYLLTLTGHHRAAARALGLSALAFVALTATGTLAWGMLGAAIGSVIGFLLWNGWLCWLVVRRLKIWPSFLPGARLAGLRTHE